MKTALRLGLFLAVLLGVASPGLGQGSMSRFTTPTQNAFGRGPLLTSPSTNGFTISAHRDFDRSVAITVSAATRFWFLESSAPSQGLVAAGRYENATLWAQATRASADLAFAVNSRSMNTDGGLFNTRNMAYAPGTTITRLDAGLSQYDESHLSTWIQSKIRFANVDPLPAR